MKLYTEIPVQHFLWEQWTWTPYRANLKWIKLSAEAIDLGRLKLKLKWGKTLSMLYT
jgi:hypothetical protein